MIIFSLSYNFSEINAITATLFCLYLYDNRVHNCFSTMVHVNTENYKENRGKIILKCTPGEIIASKILLE